MSAIDNELMLQAEEDAKEVEFIRESLPDELKEKFSDDELYYFIDVITEYYDNSDFLDKIPEDAEMDDLDFTPVAAYVVKKAKKEKMGDYAVEDVMHVITADLVYCLDVLEDDDDDDD